MQSHSVEESENHKENNNLPNYRFFNINKLSKASLSRYRTFFQNEEPFSTQSEASLEEKVQTHFNNMKIDDKEVLEKFLKLKKDEGPSAQAKRYENFIILEGLKDQINYLNQPQLKRQLEQYYKIIHQQFFMFHQRQKHWLCGLHTVNNLLQKEYYTRQSMNLLCEELTPSTFWGNEHYSKFGFGDYDINILTYALQKQDMDIVWKDSHRACTIEDFQQDNMVGIIVNQRRNTLCCIESRHWFAILRQETKVNSVYLEQDGIEFWNLDSKLQTPSQMGQEKLIDFLKELQNQGSQILYVKKKQFN